MMSTECSTTKRLFPRSFNPSRMPSQGIDVLRVEAGGGFVEHVDDAEEIRGQLGGQSQPLQLTAGQRRCGPIEREVPEAEVDDRAEPVDETLAEADECGKLVRRGVIVCVHGRLRRGDLIAKDGHEFMQRQGGEFGDVETGDRHRQSVGPEFLSVAHGAGTGTEELGDATLHPGTLRVRERVEHVLPGSDEGSRIGRFGACCDRFARFVQRQPGVDGKVRSLLGVEDPIAVFARQVLPGDIDVVAESDEHIAQLVAVPGLRPGSDGALPDRQRRIRDHLVLGHLVDAADSVAFRAGTFDGVRRKILGQQHRLSLRVPSRP
jgi:hypothetical protein